MQIHVFQSIPAVRKYRALARGNAPSPGFRRARFRIKSGRSFFLWGYSNLCANFLRTATLTLSHLAEPRCSPRSRTRGAALRLAASYAFLFWRGNALKNGMERQGSSGNGSNSSRLTAHMGRNEPFANTTRCLTKPISKRNGEALNLYVLAPKPARVHADSPHPCAHARLRRLPIS